MTKVYELVAHDSSCCHEGFTVGIFSTKSMAYIKGKRLAKTKLMDDSLGSFIDFTIHEYELDKVEVKSCGCEEA